MHASTRVLGWLLIVSMLGACGGSSSESSETTSTTTATAAGALQGEVLETMNSGGYTYVRIQSDGKDVWAAGPQTAMSVGNQVSIETRMPNPGFHSDTLDRTFDMLYFVSDFGTPAGGDPHGGAMGDMAEGNDAMGGHGQAPVANVAPGTIDAVEGGHTVAALHEARTSLAGETVTVRGRVVKFNGGIMGKNWIHVQDGTGSQTARTHDLLVTTNARCEVGDVITATGTVAVDKDFGAGYRYELLLEDAKIEVDRSTTGR